MFSFILHYLINTITESVIPPRSLGRSNSFISEYYRIFVGGVPVNTSVIDNLSGCVRGLKIGNKVFSLQQEAHLRPGIFNISCFTESLMLCVKSEKNSTLFSRPFVGFTHLHSSIETD